MQSRQAGRRDAIGAMTAIILGWNPGRRNFWIYDEVMEEVAAAGQVLKRWNVGRRRNIGPGAEAWLVLQGRNRQIRGLIGHGVVTSDSYAVEPAPGLGKASFYVSVAFDALLPLGSQIPQAELAQAAPGIAWDRYRGSGRVLSSTAAERIRRLWHESGPAALDPIGLPPGTHPETAVARVDVSRYERDAEARRLSLAYHGTLCAACGFSFEAHYGDAGRDYIQVHHLVPVAQLGAGYQLDPIADLVPLCANCHCMAHLGVKEPRSVQELRTLIASAGHIGGQLLDPNALEALQAARRIMEQR